MAQKPIIFALANPNPEISPELAKKVRPDAIIATGRPDFPNQVNDQIVFPFIYRAVLDVRSKKITTAMMIAAAKAIAEVAKLDVPDSVKEIYGNPHMAFGPEYILPTPFDSRLLPEISGAIAKSAVELGHGTKYYTSIDNYKA